MYFDTDVEVLKPIDELLEQGGFFGQENIGTVAAGLGIAAPAYTDLYAEIIQLYNATEFVNKNGVFDFTTVVVRVTDVLKRYGLKKKNEIQHINGFVIYPIDYFNPKNMQTGVITLTDNTYTIHHFAASWVTPFRKMYIDYYTRLAPLFGTTLTAFVLLPFRTIYIIQESGLRGLVKKTIKKILF